MTRILCANWQAADDAELEREHFPDVELVLARSTTYVAAVLDPADCASVDAVINYSPTLLVEVPPSAFPKARIAVRSGVGFDNLDLKGWAARGVPACNVPDYGTTEVADHAIALVLALTRGTSTYSADLLGEGAAGWHFSRAPLVRRHRHARFGVVGLGRIGLAAARRAAAFDMRVTFYDPYLSSGVELATGYDRAHSLAELMLTSDIVSIHAPLSPETQGLIGAAALAAAKPGLILVNTARGPIIDLDALAAALRDGRVAGAGLDVLPAEPGDLEHPLIAAWRAREPWIRDRLVVTPHAAFFSPASMIDLRLKSVEVAHAFLTEGRLSNCVNGVTP
ncbi:MAG: C-terminal binding protein [Rhodobacteraceae bacterium]|nr:C-terminal binding protein [Paracoccaceae bacterium]